MKKEVTKPEKVALCRECHGTGFTTLKRHVLSRSETVVCPNCDGSGRVLVSCQMVLNIRPYKESK